MKLKAILEDPKTLFDIFDLCRSTQQTCTVCLQEGTTRVFSTAESTTDVQVWAECRTNTIFREFRCQSPYNNSVVCDVLDTKHLCHVLRNAEKLREEGYEREMRLSKNSAGRPVLKLSFRSPKGGKNERYDIPIRLRSQQEIEAMQVPALDDEDSIHVMLPQRHCAEISHFVDNARGARCENITLLSKAMDPSFKRKRSRMNDEDGLYSLGRTASRGHPAELFASLEMLAEHDYAKLALQYSRVQRCPPPGYEEAYEAENEEAYDESTTGEIYNSRARPSRSSTEGGRCSAGEASVAPTLRSAAEVTIPLKKFAPFIVSVRSLDPSLVSLHLVHEHALVFCFCHARCANIAAYIPAVTPQVFH